MSTNALSEMRALFKLVATGELRTANVLLDSLDEETTRQLIFTLVGAVQGTVTGSVGVVASAADMLRAAGLPESFCLTIDQGLDAARRQFELALGTNFVSPHGS